MLASVNTNLSTLVNNFAQIDEVAQEHLFAASTESALKLEHDVRELTPTGANGFLGSSIASFAPQMLPDGVVTLMGTSLNYAPAVELGTKPHMPPIEALEDWVLKVINPAPEEGVDVVHKIATLIALKIKKHGTEGQFMFKQGFAQNEQWIKDNFTQAIANVMVRMANA